MITIIYGTLDIDRLFVCIFRKAESSDISLFTKINFYHCVKP